MRAKTADDYLPGPHSLPPSPNGRAFSDELNEKSERPERMRGRRVRRNGMSGARSLRPPSRTTLNKRLDDLDDGDIQRFEEPGNIFKKWANPSSSD